MEERPFDQEADEKTQPVEADPGNSGQDMQAAEADAVREGSEQQGGGAEVPDEQQYDEVETVEGDEAEPEVDLNPTETEPPSEDPDAPVEEDRTEESFVPDPNDEGIPTSQPEAPAGEE